MCEGRQGEEERERREARREEGGKGEERAGPTQLDIIKESHSSAITRQTPSMI